MHQGESLQRCQSLAIFVLHLWSGRKGMCLAATRCPEPTRPHRPLHALQTLLSPLVGFSPNALPIPKKLLRRNACSLCIAIRRNPLLHIILQAFRTWDTIALACFSTCLLVDNL